MRALETEAIEILLETASYAEKPVILYSIGKDSSVLLRLAQKAFFPAPPPFTFLHIDTKWKFSEMISFRDRVFKENGLNLVVHTNVEGIEKGLTPFDENTSLYTNIMKTVGLRQALDQCDFDFIVAGARRDEEKSRAKERIFSYRNEGHIWDYRNQRVEVFDHFNTTLSPNCSIRVFPLSNWTEIDVWEYIRQENIDIPELYFSKSRPFVRRGENLIMVDDQRFRFRKGETVETGEIRFRTLGCYPLTSGIFSQARTVSEIIDEVRQSQHSERAGRLIDVENGASMEFKKLQGYF